MNVLQCICPDDDPLNVSCEGVSNLKTLMLPYDNFGRNFFVELMRIWQIFILFISQLNAEMLCDTSIYQ